jgi:soluble lytic murein transglycosylase-like protein
MYLNTLVKIGFLTFIFLAFSASSCDTYQSGDYRTIAYNDAVNAGIDGNLFVNQINVESKFNPYAVGSMGEIGIAQFEPTTAAGLDIDPHDPIDSLSGAARLMASYVNTYGDYKMALAAYNCGSGCLQFAIDNYGYWWWGIPSVTRQYINEVMS